MRYDRSRLVQPRAQFSHSKISNFRATRDSGLRLDELRTRRTGCTRFSFDVRISRGSWQERESEIGRARLYSPRDYGTPPLATIPSARRRLARRRGATASRCEVSRSHLARARQMARPRSHRADAQAARDWFAAGRSRALVAALRGGSARAAVRPNRTEPQTADARQTAPSEQPLLSRSFRNGLVLPVRRCYEWRAAETRTWISDERDEPSSSERRVLLSHPSVLTVRSKKDREREREKERERNTEERDRVRPCLSTSCRRAKHHERKSERWEKEGDSGDGIRSRDALERDEEGEGSSSFPTTAHNEGRASPSSHLNPSPSFSPSPSLPPTGELELQIRAIR